MNRLSLLLCVLAVVFAAAGCASGRPRISEIKTPEADRYANNRPHVNCLEPRPAAVVTPDRLGMVIANKEFLAELQKAIDEVIAKEGGNTPREDFQVWIYNRDHALVICGWLRRTTNWYSCCYVVERPSGRIIKIIEVSGKKITK